MSEDKFLETWEAERPMYQAWGRYVAARIVELVGSRIAPLSTDIFLRVPPKPRVKGDASLLDKAFYRNKNYQDPYAAITDKVGVRFVVLLTMDIPIVEQAIEGEVSWAASKDRDFEEEQDQNPLKFDYAAVHYVVRCKEALVFDGINVGADTPCEVQVKTILQHAYSEVTHDTIYKPSVIATPQMKRAAAKSMALIEATNDYFKSVVDQVAGAVQPARALTEGLSAVYAARIGAAPIATRVEGLILDAYELLGGADIPNRVAQFLDAHAGMSDLIREKAKGKLLFRQPSILLVYMLVAEQPHATKGRWPLTPEELRPVYVDLGRNFENS